MKCPSCKSENLDKEYVGKKKLSPEAILMSHIFRSNNPLDRYEKAYNVCLDCGTLFKSLEE